MSESTQQANTSANGNARAPVYHTIILGTSGQGMSLLREELIRRRDRRNLKVALFFVGALAAILATYATGDVRYLGALIPLALLAVIS